LGITDTVDVEQESLLFVGRQPTGGVCNASVKWLAAQYSTDALPMTHRGVVANSQVRSSCKHDESRSLRRTLDARRTDISGSSCDDGRTALTEVGRAVGVPATVTG